MPERSIHSSDLALLLVVGVWGANFPILKWALAAMPPHVMNIFRFAVSALVLGGLYAWRRRGSPDSFFAPLRSHGRQLIVLGLLGYVVYQVCFIVGIDNTTSGSAALIMASAPLWTALQSQLSGYERLRPRAWLGLLLSLGGTGLVVAAGATEASVGGGSLFGNVMMLAAAAFWGAYTAYNKSVVHDVSPTGATLMGVLIAMPVLLAISGPYWSAVQWEQVDVWVWIAIVFSGGLSTGLAIAIWNTAVKNVGASNTAVYGNLVPFVALLGGMLFLGETVTGYQLVGGGLIIGGVVLVRRHRVRS
jgi:drug/metabolite transporter (DMT)-like permease